MTLAERRQRFQETNDTAMSSIRLEEEARRKKTERLRVAREAAERYNLAIFTNSDDDLTAPTGALAFRSTMSSPRNKPAPTSRLGICSNAPIARWASRPQRRYTL